MAFTRFHDDPCRIQKQLQESTDQGRYMLDMPGNGDKPFYINDPYLRLQKWGGNLMSNTINIENDLRGMTRQINRDCLLENNYKNHSANKSKIEYPTIGTITDQSRATNPAWMSRDLEQVNWYILPLNPQENTCMPFKANLNTRIIEKDNFIPSYPSSYINQDSQNQNQNFNTSLAPSVNGIYLNQTNIYSSKF